MKKLIFLFLILPLLALAQTYPSPTFNNLTLQTPLSVANGGTGSSTNVFAAPPAIGNITPNTGAFTQLITSGGMATSYSTDIGSPTAGIRYYLDNLWNPLGSNAQFNNFWQIHIPSDSMNGGTVQQRWNSSNQGILVDIATTGPTGTPSTPSGMADGHTIGMFSVETIPAGLCDGLNGSGFTGPGGSPGNNCYQEIGGIASVNTVLSPGHYAEGIASTINDNSGGAGVPIRGVAFLTNLSKNSATNTYNTYGFQANSIGTQQTTNAPTAAFRVDGGWQTSLDLSGNTNTGAASITLPGQQKINADSSNIYFSVNNVQALQLNSVGSALSGGLTVTGQIIPNTTLGILGTTLANNATAGAVGEYMSATASGISVTSGTPLNVTSKSLTAGDWDVTCAIQYNGAASTTSQIYTVGVSTASASLPAAPIGLTYFGPVATNVSMPMISPLTQINISSPTTVYCVGGSTFSASTMTASALLRARRIR